MGRKPRIEFEGAVFHVYARRVDRGPMFLDAADYREYIELLARTVDRCDWIVLSFCLMPNHIHLLVQLREPTLAKGMHWLHSQYVRWFNDRHHRTGHLFEQRYHAKLVEDELYFLTLVLYIEANPVRAALCRRPEEWPWSSRGLVAAGVAGDWLADDELTERRKRIAGT